ncbi:hypothetical protein HDU91_001167 [Kappamyces sp. JEL0680]|nr:hypothetical protein HDU91_001167 [Kappamyces sp. JEL0680]
MLDVLLLCGGFGTRIERDIRSLVNSESKLMPAEKSNESLQRLVGLPKALLPLNKRPLLDYWMELLSRYPAPTRTLLLCNALHYPLFDGWAGQQARPVLLFNNGVSSNEQRNGSVKDLWLAVQHFGLQQKPLFIVAGDTWIKDLDLHSFLATIESTLPPHASVVVHYPISDAECAKSGVLEVDPASRKVTAFLEKPAARDTASRMGCPCFYYMQPQALATLPLFLKAKQPLGLAAIDAAGSWIQWLVMEHRQLDLFAVPISGRLDIGGLETYLAADAYMTFRLANKALDK